MDITYPSCFHVAIFCKHRDVKLFNPVMFVIITRSVLNVSALSGVVSYLTYTRASCIPWVTTEFLTMSLVGLIMEALTSWLMENGSPMELRVLRLVHCMELVRKGMSVGWAAETMMKHFLPEAGLVLVLCVSEVIDVKLGVVLHDWLGILLWLLPICGVLILVIECFCRCCLSGMDCEVLGVCLLPIFVSRVECRWLCCCWRVLVIVYWCVGVCGLIGRY